MVHPHVDRKHFSTLESTQTLAKEEAHQLKPNRWILYTASEQTAGRGQYDRRWMSPPDVNIYATYSLLVPAHQSPILFHVPQVATIAIAKTLEEFGFQAKIKWINDVVIDRKKISGALCEAQTITSDACAVHIGIGLNVNMPDDLCSQLDQPATSLFAETGKLYDKEEILKSLTLRLYEEIHLLLSSGFAPFQSELNQRLAFLHETLKVEKQHPKEIVEGVFEGVDNMGRLKLRRNSSQLLVLQDGRILNQ